MKNLKRIACLIMVIAMVLCMAMPCYAVNTEEPNNTPHTITISGAKETEKDGYRAYQVFRGDITGGKLTNITWGNGVVVDEDLIYDLSNHVLIGDKIEASLTAADQNNLTEAEAVAAVVATWEDDSEKLDAFAEVIGNHLSNTYFTNGTDYDKINVTGDGYYLLQYVGDLGENDAYTKYILRVADNVEVTAKKDAPTSEKKIVEDNEKKTETNASVGDSVTFEITSTVPNMNGYDKYYYIIHDELSDGLTFNNDIKITIGKTTLVAWEEDISYADYDYVVNVTEDGHKLEIVFTDFLNRFDEKTGEKIIVTYTATLNENAVITEEGNPNNAWLQYSNDPNYDHDGDSDPGNPGDEPTDPTDPSDPTDPTDPTEPDEPDGPDKPQPSEPTGETPESIVTVYTTALQINKVDKEGKTLTGAKFQIEGERSEVYIINEQIYEKSSDGNWYRLKDGTYTDTAPTTDTAALYDGDDKYVLVDKVVENTKDSDLVNEGWVDANGVLTFGNLGAGTYTITELVSPAGYNLLKSPITVTITWNGSEAEQMWTVTASSKGIDGEDEAITATPAGDMFSINVVNQAGVTLPSTGGIGTTIFYVVGGLLVLAAVVLLVTKRRMNSAA